MADLEETERIDENTLLSRARRLSLKFRNDISHFALDYGELVNEFHDCVGQLVKISPINLYTNPLSKLIIDCLGEEIPLQILEEFKYYENDLDYSKRYEKIVDYYQTCIDDGYGIDDSEFLELYNLSLLDKANEEKYIKYLLGQIIEGSNVVDKETYQAIIERFINGIITKNKLRVAFKIGELGEIFGDEIASTTYKYGTYYITYSNKVLSPGNALEDLECIFHEIWHTVQDSCDYSDVTLVDLFKKDDFIRGIFGESYYDDNYWRMSYEVDADLHAALLLEGLLKEISPETYNINRKLLEEQSSNCQELRYNRMRIYGGNEYDIDVLFARARNKSNRVYEEKVATSEGQKKLLKVIKI